MLSVLSRLFFYVSMLCCLVSVTLFAFNLSLSQNAVIAQVNKMFSESIPHAEVDFTAAKLYWGWNGFAARVQNFSLKMDEHNTLLAPSVDFHINTARLQVFMKKPTVTIRRAANNLHVALPVGGKDWLITALDANIVFSDEATNISTSLEMADVLLRREKEQLSLGLSDDTAYGGIQIAANIKQSATKKLIGNFYLSIPQVPPLTEETIMPTVLQHLPKAAWETAALTLWASFTDEVLLTIAGRAQKMEYQDAHAQSLAWHAKGGQDKNGTIRLTVAAIANKAAYKEWLIEAVHWQAAIAPAAASVAFTVRASDLLFPRLQDNITTAVDVLAQGSWKGNQNGSWSLTDGFIATSVHVSTAVLSANLSLSGQGRTVINIAANGQGDNFAVTTAAQYMPSGEVREWMASSLQNGVFNQLTFAVSGSFAGLAEKLEGLSLKTSFTDARILIGDGWPEATALAGVLSINNNTLRIVGEGEIGGLFVSDIIAEIPSLTTPQPPTLWMNINVARTSIDDYLAAFQSLPPIQKTVKNIIANFSYTGNGALLLSLDVPLNKPKETEINATMALGEGQLSLLNEPLFSPLDITAGTVLVNDKQVGGMINGFWRQLPMSAFFSEDTYILKSTIEATTVISLFNLTALCQNCASGKSAFRISADTLQTVFFLPLNGVGINLPPPFGKASTDNAMLSLVFRDDDVSVSYLNGDDQIRLLYQNGSGDIAINTPSAPPPKNNQFNIRGSFSGLNADELISSYSGLIIPSTVNNSNGNNNIIGDVSLTLSNAVFLGEQQSLLVVQSPAPSSAYRRVRVKTKPFAGDMLVGNNFLSGNINHIYYPTTDADGFSWQNLTLALTVENFFTDDTLWGQVLLQGSPDDDGTWHLQTLVISSNGNFLSASGTLLPSLAMLSVHAQMPSLAALLQSHNITGFISSGKMSLDGDFFWQTAANNEWRLEDLDGTISMQGQDMRYTKSETDIFRFLSVLSPKSLFNLGFTELENPGVQSFKIAGEMRFNDAFIISDEILITSDDIDIILRGKTDIRRRQYDLKGRVFPGSRIMSAGSTISLGSTLAGATAFNPPAFLAAFLLGKIFEKPLSEIGAYDYTITGDWEDPVYTEIGITGKQQKDTDK